MRRIWGFAFVLCCANTLSAANIVTVADADPDTPGTAFIASNGPLAVSWTQTQSFTNVTIQAAIGFPTSVGGTATIQAFLTTQIGAGTTATHQIAATGSISAPITVPNTPQPLFTLFSGLSLGPGTYYLSVFPVSGGTAAWDFENPFALTSDTGSTANGYFRAPSVDAFPPASAFTAQTFGPGFFQVTGDQVPEAQVPTLNQAGLLVLFAALATAGLASVRRRRLGSI